MRPLELKVRNFRSYFGDESVFDFRDRRLVGIVGPIGSGKSSLLDAVSFALYGRTASVAANTKSLIHQRADEAAVSLLFEVEGEVWEAARMLRRRGASQHALYRLDPGGLGEPIERIVLEGEVNDRVVELLGLEHDAFGRSVMLAQGRFAEFLAARPAERDKVLKGVFGHDRIDAMREAARQWAREKAVEVEKLDVRVELLERVAADLPEMKSQLAAAAERVARLEAAAGEVRRLNKGVESGLRRVAEAEARLSELADHERCFPKRDDVAAIVDVAAETARLRSEQGVLLEKAQAGAAAAEGAVRAKRDSGEEELFEQAAAALATLEPLQAAAANAERARGRVAARLEATRSAVEGGGKRMSAAAKRLKAANAAVEAASRAAEEAALTLHEAQHEEMSAELRTTLRAGKPCPVCEQVVTDVPASAESPVLSKATADHRRASRALETAQADRASAAEEHAAAASAVEEAQRTLAGLQDEGSLAATEAATTAARVADAMGSLEALLGEGDPGTMLAARRREHDALLVAVQSARESLDRARTRHDRLIRDDQDAQKALSALRVDLADLGARIGVPAGRGESEDADALKVFDDLRRAWAEAHDLATTAKEEAAESAAEADRERSALLDDLRVMGDFATVLGEVFAKRELLDARIERAEVELAEGADVIADRARLAAEQATFERLASDLTDSRFVRYLLDDERARLAALGSEHFARLSSGRYLFTDDGKFDIVDQTSAGAVRRAESLSGGETFLASLALALALAEMVARTGGRLDAFFLDEGFGSLDPEHLDLAMDGIEALVAGNERRLVVVVSHVPELRERLEDLIILDRNPVTGDTRVLQS